MPFNQQDNPCKWCALGHREKPFLSYWKWRCSDHFAHTLRKRKDQSRAFPCLLLVRHHAGDLCCTPVVAQINKWAFPKHIAASWRSTWKVNGLNLKPHPYPYCGVCFVTVLSRRHWCHPAAVGEVQCPRSSFALLLLILLLFCFITLMWALLMPFHSVPQSDSKATVVYLKEKVFHLLLSQNIAYLANAPWCDYGTVFSCTVTKI